MMLSIKSDPSQKLASKKSYSVASYKNLFYTTCKVDKAF